MRYYTSNNVELADPTPVEPEAPQQTTQPTQLFLANGLLGFEGYETRIRPLEEKLLRVVVAHSPQFVSRAQLLSETASARIPRISEHNISQLGSSLLDIVNMQRSVLKAKVAQYDLAALGLIERCVIVPERDFTASPKYVREFKVTDPQWYKRAACIDANPDDFLPNSKKEEQATRLRYCRGCPVRDDCLAEAVINGEMHGVRGGFITDERHTFYLQYKKFLEDQKNAPKEQPVQPASASVNAFTGSTPEVSYASLKGYRL